MNKKILAGALASVMAVACAANVSALETEMDFGGFWTGHTEGVEITADGIEITFTATTHEGASNNWNTPLYVVYAGNEAKVNGDGYVEYFVGRSDLWGWSPAGDTGANALGDGYVWTPGEAPADWAAWVTECQGGVSGSLTATKGSGNVTVTFTVNGVTSTVVIPAADDTVYVSLFGEECKLTNIKLVDNTPAPAPEPGDGNGATDGAGADPNKGSPDTGVEGVAVVAGLAIIAAGAVVVAKKRK